MKSGVIDWRMLTAGFGGSILARRVPIEAAQRVEYVLMTSGTSSAATGFLPTYAETIGLPCGAFRTGSRHVLYRPPSSSTASRKS